MERVFIIAEAGVNHNGDLNTALKMVEVAAKAGADAIKFQTFCAEKVASSTARKANYQSKTTPSGESQMLMLKALELSREDHAALIRHSNKNNIQFLSTPFDLESIELLISLGLKVFKIPSGEITNLPYLRKVGSLRKNIILSTGMSDIEEIRKAIEIIISEGTPRDMISLLHATTEYPAPYDEVNLNAIVSMGNIFGLTVGYSDHTMGIEVPIAAVAMGAMIIEKHFTLSRMMDGPDHKASLEPEELSEMVKAIRHIEIALGDGIKRPSPSEIKNLSSVRRSIHYANSFPAGHIIEEGDLIMKRPGDGISPMELDNLIKRVLGKSVLADTQVRWEDLN